MPDKLAGALVPDDARGVILLTNAQKKTLKTHFGSTAVYIFNYNYLRDGISCEPTFTVAGVEHKRGHDPPQLGQKLTSITPEVSAIPQKRHFREITDISAGINGTKKKCFNVLLY